jgi:hypothetical protein
MEDPRSEFFTNYRSLDYHTKFILHAPEIYTKDSVAWISLSLSLVHFKKIGTRSQ